MQANDLGECEGQPFLDRGARSVLSKRTRSRRQGRYCIKVASVSILSLTTIFVALMWDIRDGSPAHFLPRQELRELRTLDLSVISSAMWTLKHRPRRGLVDFIGKLRFGAQFLSYDEFVEKHWADLSMLRCGDKTLHSGSALFGIYHALLVDEFEAALGTAQWPADYNSRMKIPIWNWTLDVDAVSRQLSSDWEHDHNRNVTFTKPPKLGLSPALLGSLAGNLDDGLFSGWSVTKVPAYSAYKNSLGWLRSSDVDGPGVVRMGTFCNSSVTFPEHLWCSNASSFESWSQCSIVNHQALHRAIGGAQGCTRSTLHDGSEAVVFAGPRTVGDFEAGESSVNDPVFFFVHAYFVESLAAWAEQWDSAGRAPSAWRSMWDALQKDLEPCRAHGRWKHHRFSPVLFNWRRFRDRFSTKRKHF